MSPNPEGADKSAYMASILRRAIRHRGLEPMFSAADIQRLAQDLAYVRYRIGKILPGASRSTPLRCSGVNGAVLVEVEESGDGERALKLCLDVGVHDVYAPYSFEEQVQYSQNDLRLSYLLVRALLTQILSLKGHTAGRINDGLETDRDLQVVSRMGRADLLVAFQRSYAREAPSGRVSAIADAITSLIMNGLDLDLESQASVQGIVRHFLMDLFFGIEEISMVIRNEERDSTLNTAFRVPERGGPGYYISRLAKRSAEVTTVDHMFRRQIFTANALVKEFLVFSLEVIRFLADSQQLDRFGPE